MFRRTPKPSFVAFFSRGAWAVRFQRLHQANGTRSLTARTRAWVGSCKAPESLSHSGSWNSSISKPPLTAWFGAIDLVPQFPIVPFIHARKEKLKEPRSFNQMTVYWMVIDHEYIPGLFFPRLFKIVQNARENEPTERIEEINHQWSFRKTEFGGVSANHLKVLAR